MKYALFALVLVACEPPQPTLELTFSEGPAQACPATCAEIPMLCRTFMGVRIVDPSDPSAPFHFECKEIPDNIRENICQLGGVELETYTLPYRDLEVQIAIYPEQVVDLTGPLPVCPSTATFDAIDGFPITVATGATPALGGRGYYRPGDDLIHVTLGCTDLSQLVSEECGGGVANTTVKATVDDFDTHLSVDNTQANRLDVAVGEPVPSGEDFALRPTDVTPLDRAATATPVWSRDVPRIFQASACLTVDEDTAGSTTTATCMEVGTIDSQLSLVGVRLSKSSLDQILAALALAQFPSEGLTIGVVVDGGTPIGGQVVTSTSGTIEYLNSARTTTAGTATAGGAMGGVFVSRDAVYNTTFSTSRLGTGTATAIGGRIDDKVTIVVLDLSRPTQPD